MKINYKDNNREFRRNYRKAVKKLMRSLKVRRDNKSSLFTKLFSDKKELLDLYNALNDSDYTDTNMITVTTIDDYIYLSYKNDCSFIIGNVLNLYEHQSTLNPNMPIRGLGYFADIYRAYIESKEFNIYGTALVKLPTPVFVVFYNGEEETEDRFEYRLSDAFEGGAGCLECVATVININQGHNAELLGKCKTLMGYSQFVSKTREYKRMGYARNEAVSMAIDWCIDNDILKELFLKHRGEVRHMFKADHDVKTFIRIWEKDYQQRYVQLEEEMAKKMEEKLAEKLEEKLAERLAEKEAEIAEKLAEKEAEIAEKLAEKDAEIARLKKQVKSEK